MASPLRIGQVVKGMRDVYDVAQKLHDQVWRASTPAQKQVVLKCAPETRLQREKDILQEFAGNAFIRQLIDCGKETPCLVLEHLESDALTCSSKERMSKQDIKLIARSILSALDSLHAKGIVHTDIKPNNILLNFDTSGVKVVEAKLADCGDACKVENDPRGTSHAIGAAIFRSPEALMGLKWSTSTDIWSFGTTLISLIWGQNFHIFKPPEIPADDEDLPINVLLQQTRYFGPFPLSYETLLDKQQESILAAIHYHIEEHNIRKPFIQAEDEEMTAEDKEFLLHVLQLDPRDRPTARALRGHKWLDMP
ncbi:Hypothetical protein R9X50_00056700 [Acrodontium crateriforme]|uniref:Protein kinase domain-containing protein n=1 Tax=Acrodontium crateriforme TaxID=150365 RepID=A0AAQ3LYC5_9PEZI|nr:Hypothetical protein R9X50_00056700 [Acrodontium crateriforme]